MARPLAFDETRALEAAMDRFWGHGYAATSVRDLADCAGIGGTSLYNTFGDKRALFLRALDHYGETRMRVRLARFAAMDDARAAIAAFLGETVERSLGAGGERGCFIVNTALDMAPHDPDVARRIAARLGEIEQFLLARVAAAQAAGAVDPAREASDLARLLLAAMLSIRVLARARPERDLLEAIARAALDALGPAPARTARSI